MFFKKNTKKVSAVIPNYNYARYLEERIESILNQTYPVYEVIILDDCSSDNSREVIQEEIEKIKKLKPNIKVRSILNQNNSGNVFKQWEKAFDNAEGDFVWIAEADDSCSKHFLKTIMRAFNDPEVVLAESNTLPIDECSKKISDDVENWRCEYDSHFRHNFVNNGEDEIRNYLYVCNSILNASGVVFRKSAVNKSFLRGAQKFHLAGDWHFYVMVLGCGKIAYFSKKMNYFRIHKNSTTKTTNHEQHLKEILSVQQTIRDKYCVDEAVEHMAKEQIQMLRNVWGIK